MADAVPPALQRLVRIVLRTFYTIEHSLLMDLLIRKPCMKEDELESLLRFERKQLRALIAQLRTDKMLKARLKMETGPDGKATRQNYHYINYKAFVNVVKYKLDHMRRKIETEERDSTSRSSFVCTECKMAFTDLQVDQLCDYTTGMLKCSNCGSLVDEDPNVKPQADARLVLAKFNDQMAPLYLLLKEVEDIKLPSDLLEPEPSDNNGGMAGNRNDNRPAATVHIETGDLWRSGQRRGDLWTMDMDTSFTVKLEGNDAVNSIKTENGVSDGKRPVKKEQPAWLTTSTIDYDTPDGHVNGGPSTGPIASTSTSNRRINEYDRNNGNAYPIPGDGESAMAVISKEILETLMQNERDGSEGFAEALSYLRAPDQLNENPFAYQNGTDSQDEDGDVIMDSDDEDEGPHVRVGGRKMRLRDMDESIVEQMTPSELTEYIKLAQDLHSYLYD
jgi:transcription initiation factor TFIIE subunit alpha